MWKYRRVSSRIPVQRRRLRMCQRSRLGCFIRVDRTATRSRSSGFRARRESTLGRMRGFSGQTALSLAHFREFNVSRTIGRYLVLIRGQIIPPATQPHIDTRTHQRRHPRADDNIETLACRSFQPRPRWLAQRLFPHLRIARQPWYCRCSPGPPRRQRAYKLRPYPRHQAENAAS